MGKRVIPGKWTGESTPDPESGHEFYSMRRKRRLRAGSRSRGEIYTQWAIRYPNQRFGRISLDFTPLRFVSLKMTSEARWIIHSVMVVISTDRREWRNLLPGTRFMMYISAVGWDGYPGSVQYKFVFIFLFVFYILILIHIVFRRHSAADCGKLRQGQGRDVFSADREGVFIYRFSFHGIIIEM